MSYPATWTKLSSGDALQRSSHSATFVAPHLYVFGGELHPRQPRDHSLHRISLPPSAAALTTLPPPVDCPSPRVGTATTSLRDSIYLYSGRGGPAMAPIEESGALWVHTPATSEWTRLAPAGEGAPSPAARSYHAMTSDGEDTIYLHAGCPEKGRLADFWEFRVSARAWRELPPAPGKARGGTSIAFAEGRVWRVNGFDGEREIGGKVDYFDVAKGEWGAVEYAADGKEGPEARSVGVLVPVRRADRGTVLVTAFGERDPSSLGHQGAGKMLGDVWAFDILGSKWGRVETGGEGPEARGWFDADVVEVDGEEQVAVVGGLGESNERLDDAWLLSLR